MEGSLNLRNCEKGEISLQLDLVTTRQILNFDQVNFEINAQGVHGCHWPQFFS